MGKYFFCSVNHFRIYGQIILKKCAIISEIEVVKAIVREKPALIFDPALFGKMHLLIRRLVLVFETQSFSKLANINCCEASHRLYASLSFVRRVSLSWSVISRSIVTGAENSLKRDTVGFFSIPLNVSVSLGFLSSNTFVSIKSIPFSSRRPIEIGITIGCNFFV